MLPSMAVLSTRPGGHAMKSKPARKRSDLVPSRRQVLQGGLAAAGLAAASPLIAACKSKSSGTSGKSQLKIGFVSPRTGPTAGFGEPDGYVLELARKALGGGLAIGGTTYEVQVVDK